jgi:dinuclear metal center YbgI/SA1388 family protein
MTTVLDIYQYIDSFAPFQTQMSFDNCGLQTGNPQAEVHSVLLALDITPAVVEEAVQKKAQLIVSHHPVIFNPLRALTADTVPYQLAQHGIAAICAHTNLDLAPGGVNTCLAKRLMLSDVQPLAVDEPSGLAAALCGQTARSYSPNEFAAFVKKQLNCDGLFYTDGGRPIKKVGLCSGAGSDYLREAAEKGCQAFVTGEAKHHELHDAVNLGITLVAAGHYFTEDVVIEPLIQRLKSRFPGVLFQRAETSRCPANYS